MPSVLVPPPYRGATDGAARIEVDAGTVRESLERAIERHPALGELLLDANGAPQRFVKLFVGEDPVAADALDKPVGARDEINIVAAIGGG